MSTDYLSPSCGIDFGTTNSTVALVKDNQPFALAIDPENTNSQILKSIIYANPKGIIKVGQSALDHYLSDLINLPSLPPKIINTGRFVKTFDGAGKAVTVPEIIEVDDSGRGRLLQSLKSVLTSTSFYGTNLFGKTYTLTNLLSLLLGQIKDRAESACQHSLINVVLGRPVRYVGDPANEKLALDRLTQVAHQVGFKNVAFEYEPVGAALSFGLDITKSQKVLVFDFGGGTLDVCIMEYPSKKVLAVSGQPIGGDLVDSCLVKQNLLHFFGSKVTIAQKTGLPKYLLEAISHNWYQISMLKTIKILQSFEYFLPNADDRLPLHNLQDLIINDQGYNFFNTVDQTKIKLTTQNSTDFDFSLPHQKIHQTITRQKFEADIQVLVNDSADCIKHALHLAGLAATGIDQVILTGGSSKIPLFQQMIISMFGQEKLFNSDPFTSVALGLALKADQIFT